MCAAVLVAAAAPAEAVLIPLDHDVGVAGGGFRAKHHIDASRNGLGPFPVVIKLKNFGDVSENIGYAVTSSEADSFSAACTGTVVGVAPNKKAAVSGCEVTYAGSADPDPTLTLTVTHNDAHGGSDSNPSNNSKSKSFVIVP